MNKATVVIEGGNVGAAIALGLAMRVGVGNVRWFIRRDGDVQLEGEGDGNARARWVGAMRDCGMAVMPAPWEKPKGDK